ncbi:hypothetical protein [Acidipila rosea]|uniref:Uncharacterized protein n=1 Tax=Acidipila rosea TaxID=768535 RepID=A0A4R1L9L9_9BACT|nr:hypothetical protein [Acidipila rosea]MBW4028414.1 hypothetical protein [Acidobacteriota bacterium]MBW4046034.1 hypothetical protein [Acidobacteriota bacterium]TCK75048.1 hypothetical protein C7378_0027 [Acidipila rosea]
MLQSSRSAHIDNVVQSIRQRVEASRSGPKIDKPIVEAIDVVHHALAFTRHARALEIWRAALWEKRFDPQAEIALRVMLVYLLAAVDRGEIEAVSEICDCLHEILPRESPHLAVAASV